MVDKSRILRALKYVIKNPDDCQIIRQETMRAAMTVKIEKSCGITLFCVEVWDNRSKNFLKYNGSTIPIIVLENTQIIARIPSHRFWTAWLR
jgi:hypothetical protein